MKVLEIKRLEDSEEVIECKFEHNNQKGTFTYVLIGREIGINEVSTYEEQEKEDIYQEIHDWVEENVTSKTIVKAKGFGVVNYM